PALFRKSRRVTSPSAGIPHLLSSEKHADTRPGHQHSVLAVPRDVNPRATAHDALDSTHLGNAPEWIAGEDDQIGEPAGLQRADVAIAVQKRGSRAGC